jgi:hypothetical protein
VLTPEEVEAKKAYDETGETKWLSAEQRQGINMARHAEGKDFLKNEFGSFEEDRDHLLRIQTIAGNDYPFMSKHMATQIRRWQTGTEEDREATRGRLRKIIGEGGVSWPEDATEDFSKWVCQYLQHAGYLNPQMSPMMWKQIFITAFPPLTGSLTKSIADIDFVNNPVPVWLRIDRWFQGFAKMDRMNQQEITGLSRLRVASLTISGL